MDETLSKFFCHLGHKAPNKTKKWLPVCKNIGIKQHDVSYINCHQVSREMLITMGKAHEFLPGKL